MVLITRRASRQIPKPTRCSKQQGIPRAHSEPEVWRFARAYTDACGIISLEKFVELYNSCAPKPVSIFEVNETIWKIRDESGRIDNPCMLSRDGELYLITPELDDTVENNPYYYDDYGYSYRKYKRHSEYTEEMRSLRERRVQSRRAAIFAAHKQHPIKNSIMRTLSADMPPTHGLLTISNWIS